MHHLRLETLSDPARLAPIRRAVEAFSACCGFDDVAVGDVGLCVNEALANVTRHAYAGAEDGRVVLQAEFENDGLVIRLRDWGNGKVPPGAPPRHDPLTPGGLGLVCLHSLMDELVYDPQPDGMLLTLKKRLGAGQP